MSSPSQAFWSWTPEKRRDYQDEINRSMESLLKPRGGLVSLLDPTGEIGRRPADVMSLIGLRESEFDPGRIGTGGGFPLPPGYEGSQKPSSRLGEEFSGKGTSTLLGQTDMVRSEWRGKEYVGIPWGPEVIDHGPRRIPGGNGTRPERMPYFKHPNPFPQPSVIPDWQKKGPEHGIQTTLESILKILEKLSKGN
jgi:hypothetical protein